MNKRRTNQITIALLVMLASGVFGAGSAFAGTPTESALLAKVAEASETLDKASMRAAAIDRDVTRNRSTIKAIERSRRDGGDPDELTAKLKAAALELHDIEGDLDETTAVIATQRVILKKVNTVSVGVESKKLEKALAEAFAALRAVEKQTAAVQDEIDANAVAIKRLARKL